jgi:F420-non-reducing hydrogenase iron-sulfur subunit
MEGNYKALRRIRLLKRMMKDMGVHEDRFRLEWISASEGEKVKTTINEMTARVRELGPLGLPERFREWDKEMDALEHTIAAQEEAVHA